MISLLVKRSIVRSFRRFNLIQMITIQTSTDNLRRLNREEGTKGVTNNHCIIIICIKLNLLKKTFRVRFHVTYLRECLRIVY